MMGHLARTGGTATLRSIIRSGVIAGALAALVVLLRWREILVGAPALVVVAMSLLVFPTSREFSRRLLLTGLIVFGWNQVIWWVHVPIDRATPIMALVIGAAGGWISWSSSRNSTARWIPRFRPVDSIPPLTAALGVWTLRGWVFPQSPESALAILLPGWDNSGHFDMFHMIWSHGRTMDGIAPPGVSEVWHYNDYPQAFHATMASIAQIGWPRAVNDIGASLIVYDKSSAIVIIAAVTTVVAGLCSIPTMRRRSDVAAPLAGIIAGTFLLGPGLSLVQAGFGAFLVPCAYVAAAIFVVFTIPRFASPIYVAALCGAILGVAHGWILLLTLVAPIGASALLPLRSFYWRATRARWIWVCILLAAGGAGVLHAFNILRRSGSSPSLAIPGGIVPPPTGLTVALSLGAVGACIVAMATARVRGRADQLIVWRFVVLAMAAVAAGVVLIYLAHIQIAANGIVGYYFWKFLTGWTFVAVTIITVATSSLVRQRRSRGTFGSRTLLGIGSIFLALALTQVYGYVGPTNAVRGLVSSDTASVARAEFRALASQLAPDAHDLLDAAEVPIADPLNSAYLQDPSITRLNPINAQQWFLSLHEGWTERTNMASIALDKQQVTVEGAAWVAGLWLANNSGTLVVSPSLHAQLAGSASGCPARPCIATWR
jgi:hypothetical protein